ncbi:hypothetical protein SDJN03_18658, partial [Cucurbita argyrosperma subsp. sororia]
MRISHKVCTWMLVEMRREKARCNLEEVKIGCPISFESLILVHRQTARSEKVGLSLELGTFVAGVEISLQLTSVNILRSGTPMTMHTASSLVVLVVMI